MTDLFKLLMPYEEKWCKMMGYFNPYIDGFKTHLTNQMPFFDKACYERYPRYQRVYESNNKHHKHHTMKYALLALAASVIAGGLVSCASKSPPPPAPAPMMMSK